MHADKIRAAQERAATDRLGAIDRARKWVTYGVTPDTLRGLSRHDLTLLRTALTRGLADIDAELGRPATAVAAA